MAGALNIVTKAYVVNKADDPFVLTDVVLDGLREDEVLVEVKYTGVCHSDIFAQKGLVAIKEFPAVLGHEGAGIVRQVGPGVPSDRLAPGDTVQLTFRSCGRCRACLEGRSATCPSVNEINLLATGRDDGTSPISLPDGTPVYGQFFGQSSFSKLVIVPQTAAVKVDVRPEDLAFLAPLSCGYMTGAGTVLNVLQPKSVDSIAVLGVGSVGLAAMLAAKSLGLEEIIAVDIQDSKLQIALELGAKHTINTKTNSDLNAAIRNILPDGVNFVVDTTSSRSLMEAAFQSLAAAGTLALVGAAGPEARIEVSPFSLVSGSRRVIGVAEGGANPQTFIPHMIQLYYDGKMPLDRLAKIYPATDLDRAIEDLRKGSVVKPILSWEGIN
ncbi:Alcohol dehydrogenase superfamily, zinc-type [Pleurostoma richardsiae]|uniref:Alcohol dehydrogenase superfamily, zinc-type n=1 Tax=Pleurostoma richardsiae TaxID=41990 RepID=A0AA38RDV8_9PEZI|nr:Alcohol dehydrogenase superfamily, zinc-type [Pleurostoma richardsiae]